MARQIPFFKSLFTFKMQHTFVLGSELQDKITGFKGIAISRVEYINGCVQYCVKPQQLDEKGAMKDGEYFDVGQLIKVGEGVNKAIVPTPTGGPQRDQPKGR